MKCSEMSESGYSMSQMSCSTMSQMSCSTESDSDMKKGEHSADELSIVHNRPEEDVVMVDRETQEGPQSVTPSKVCRPFRCRKLLVVLRQQEIEKKCCWLESIRSRFKELEIQVEVEPHEIKPNAYTLVFPNYEQAEEVLSRSDEIGYKITKKVSTPTQSETSPEIHVNGRVG